MMMIELAVMTGVVALVYQKARLNVWLALIAAAIAGRVVLAVLAVGLGKVLGLPPAMTTWGTLAAGLPGIVLQFVVIPPIVSRLRVYSIRRER
jgi:hypothetical protein